MAFPQDAQVERCIIDDGFGPINEPVYTYELICSEQEADRLIRELNLTKQPSGLASTLVPSSGWGVAELWAGGGIGQADFMWVEVDATRIRLRILCGHT